MSHYGEDDLILYYYGEGRGRSDVERHLASCAACAAAYQEIAGTLAAIVEPAVPERGDQYGLEVWQRIRHRLPEQEMSWWRFVERVFRGERFMLAAAAATLAIAAFVAGRFWAPSPLPAPAVTSKQAPADAGAPDFRHRILMASVADHLDRSERVLTGLMNASDPGDISLEQRWAEDLLTTGRLYRQDALDIGEGSVAGVLDDLERSLIEIVHSPSPITAADLDQMRRRIDAATLLFKVRVLGDELRERDGAPAGVTAPRTSTGKTS
jgi:hypothetical protein